MYIYENHLGGLYAADELIDDEQLYCEECGETVVTKDEPTVCPKCGCKKFRQDEDVLDTWFSSALWPFSTLGYPDKT